MIEHEDSPENAESSRQRVVGAKRSEQKSPRAGYGLRFVVVTPDTGLCAGDCVDSYPLGLSIGILQSVGMHHSGGYESDSGYCDAC